MPDSRSTDLREGDHESPGEGRWISLPHLSGSVRLVTGGGLVESNPLGFSIESSQRVLVPHVYRVSAVDARAHRVPDGQSASDSFAPTLARAVWCHLLHSPRPLYRAGFERTESAGAATAVFASRPAADESENQRRRERSPATSERLELHLVAEAGIRLLSVNAAARHRLRFSSTLLPSLRTRVELRLENDGGAIDMAGLVVNVGPLAAEGGMPRSWLEVEVEEESRDALSDWFDGGRA